MEGASVTIFITVQKIYYPLLCIMGIPGLYFSTLFCTSACLELFFTGIMYKYGNVNTNTGIDAFHHYIYIYIHI